MMFNPAAGWADEPTSADLSEIVREEPLITAEVEMLDAEIGILLAAERGGLSALDWRRLRRANRRVIRAALDLAAADLADGHDDPQAVA